jgi:peptidoglycan-N-acetylglucosamine deacetylase
MATRPVSWFNQAIRRGLAAALPRRIFLTQGPWRSGSVCLTFDDGPHPELTPRLLDLLAENSVRATFFVIGREAEKFPQLVRRMVDDGHCVGSHSYSHRPRGSLNAREAADEITRGAEVVGAILGDLPKLYRPPAGKLTGRDLLKLWCLGFTTVLWNVDPKDYNKPSAEAVKLELAKRKLESGDLVLLHDTHPHAVAILPDLIASTRESGLVFGTVEAWLK